MVFKGTLYILNLLCGIIPCEHNVYPYPDTSISNFDSEINTTPPVEHSEAETIVNNTNTNVTTTRLLLHSNQSGLLDESFIKKNLLCVSNEIEHEHEPDPLVVNTMMGAVRGYWMRVVGGRMIRAFEGIPYAQPPVKERRFQAPLPAKPWNGILEATLKGPKCLQYNDIPMARVVGSENCLFLNIYSPTADCRKNSTLYPVIIYIHGGGFLTGSGNDFGPAYLLQRDLILVTLNFRLGVLGFMSTADDVSQGNYGLKDQAEGINWVYNNINDFNGNRDQITLLGHGSGAAAVHFHMISSKSRGKFQGGISISGTAFNPWAMHTRSQALNLTKTFAKSLHCPIHGNISLSVDCLKEKRAAELVKMQIPLLDIWPAPLSLFRPVVEQQYHKEEAFLTQSPEAAYHHGNVDKVPWIVGQAENEGFTFLLSHVALGTFGALREKWNSFAADFLNYNDLSIDQEEITRRVNWFYFRNVTPETQPLKTFSNAVSSRLIHTGIHKALQAHSEIDKTYAFTFGYNGQYNLATSAGIKPSTWGVGHGEILGYILNSSTTYTGFKRTDPEMNLSKILVNLLFNFAEKQVPGFTTDNGDNFHIWNPINDPKNISFLHIDKNIKMTPEPYLDQILYWESLGLPDAIPLANYSEEIENVPSDPESNGFVSTDVTNTEIDIPPDLKPPGEFKENTFEVYKSLNGSFVLTLENTTSPLSPSPPPPPASITKPKAAVEISSTKIFPPNVNIRSVSPIWIAQDFDTAVRFDPPMSMTTTTTTQPPPEVTNSVGSTGGGGEPPLTLRNLGNGILNFLGLIRSENNDESNNNNNQIHPAPFGVSVPIIPEKAKRTTPTISGMGNEHFNSFGADFRNLPNDPNSISELDSVDDEDETMITSDNDNYY